MSRLPLDEARLRAARIALVLTDNDGTLTDGRVYYSDRGEELKAYSLRDGMGVERLRQAGVQTAIITRETSRLVRRRAEKLSLPYLFTGVADKRSHLPLVLDATGLRLDQVAYLGDDVNDLGVMEVIAPAGLIAAPGDAMRSVTDVVHFVTESQGGHGAFREFAEWLLSLRGADA